MRDARDERQLEQPPRGDDADGATERAGRPRRQAGAETERNEMNGIAQRAQLSLAAQKCR